jgi:hypothetical protein
VVLIAINLALGFFFHSFIAWQAHIGGLLTGALLTAAYAYAPPGIAPVVQAAATVAVVALIVVAVMIRNGQITSGALLARRPPAWCRSVPPGGEDDGRDDEPEADHEVPRAEGGKTRHRPAG